MLKSSSFQNWRLQVIPVRIFFRQSMLLEACESSVMMLLDFTRQLNIISIVGLPVVVGNLLLNCAVVIQKGQLLGIVPKTYLPNYSKSFTKEMVRIIAGP